MGNVVAADNGLVTWARYACVAYSHPRRITVHDEKTARFDIASGDRCGIDKDRNPCPQRAMLLPSGTDMPQNEPVTVSFDMTISAGPVNDALWVVLHQWMPKPDQDAQKHWIEPFPSPELALELLTDKGAEYLRFVTRTYPDKINTTATKPGTEACRWPLERGKRYSVSYTYVSAQGQPSGSLEVVVNGQTLCSLLGVETGSNDDHGPYPSFGIYREGHAVVPMTVVFDDLLLDWVSP